MYRFSVYYQQLSQRLGNVTVRDLYDSDRHDERLRSLKRITVWLATFYFSYTLVDINLLPDITLRSVLLRGLIVGPPTIMLFAYYQRSVSIRRKELAGVCQACLGTLVWCAVLLGSNDPNVLNYFYAGLVFFLVLTIVITPRLSTVFMVLYLYLLAFIPLSGFWKAPTPGTFSITYL